MCEEILTANHYLKYFNEFQTFPLFIKTVKHQKYDCALINI